MKNKLSILKNAGSGSVTYYVGDNQNHVSHLKDCQLICKQPFYNLTNVHQIIVDDPQLYFYKLSHTIPNEYTFTKDIWGNYNYTKGSGCEIHPTAVIGDGVVIGDNVTIGPNSVIYSKTQIGDGTRIDANCSIGTEGMMWVWGGDEKVFLKQLGGVKIGKNCIIGSNTAIVRGSSNEYTIIEDGVNMAPGCCIGHGTYIGKNTHLANNVTTGGSTFISAYNFIGCASTISPGVKITKQDVVIGSGCVVVDNIDECGIYVGVPAKLLKSIEGKLNGIPNWRV
jgi:UDP-3-O-[3-hydroxymyristoyl] glucosamine N-acyltransferase